ncbi:MAG: DUF2207 domain-containing protein [Thermodesulfobacteriota bacterium]
MAGTRFFLRGLLVALWVAGLWILPGPAAAGADQAERILSFRSHIVVHADASLTVTEKITVNCARREIKRGIVRDFPTRYRNRFGNTVRVGFDVKKVLRDGRPEPYHLKAALNGEKIYIGQKDVYLKPGVYTYTITYETNRQLGFFEDFDELYWNVTGTGWTFPIERAEAVVTLPEGATVTEYAAYTGPAGATGEDFRVSYNQAGDIVFFTTRGLKPGEGLTIAVAWPKGFVTEPSKTEKTASFLKDNLSVFLGLIWLLVLMGYYLMVWNRVGRDPGSGVIIPLFQPPQGFSPAATRFLMHLGFDNKAFTAAVVDMAVKGHLVIEENSGDYTLRKGNRNNAPLSSGERKLAGSLFSSYKDAVELDNKNHSIIGKARDALKSTLNRELTKVYFLNNSQYLIPGAVLTLLGLGLMVLTSPAAWEAGFSMLWLSLWTVGCCFLVVGAWKKWRFVRGLELRQWGKIMTAVGASIFTLFFLAGEVLGFYLLASTMSLAAGLILVALILTNCVFYYLLKAPTLKGRRVMDQIEGFKLYLSVAEKERLEMFHPPEKTPELFEKYLPYALALDVENQWSEQFAEVLAQAQVEGQAYSPVWYHGRSWDSFHPSRFSDTLGSSFAGAIASAATAPGSSSGSGGGGFSGGGGGGGGGSGW